jgi:hypothetical protein
VTPVYLEIGGKRAFAAAFDWPGWCRAGRNEEQALAALAAAAPRYRPVAAAAGLAFPERHDLEVLERLPGTATTDFGAPGVVPARDSAAPVTADEAASLAAFLVASWEYLERVVAGAPAVLRKGPRGGGRDRDAIVTHVAGAESAYARKLAGIKVPEPAPGDEAAVAALRAAILEALRRPSDGGPLLPNGWPQRYAARRLAWHVLDHAWEIEDRSA